MMTRAKVLVAMAIISILHGCISSTTTNAPRRTESDDASAQNYQLGAQYFRNGSYELARDRLERAIDFNPKNSRAISMLALTHVQLGNTRLAIEAFDRAVKVAPDNHDVRNAFAVFLCGQEDYDEAQKQFDRAIDIRANENPEIMMTNAGVCMANKPDLELAETYFRDAIDVRPNYGEALLQLAALKHRTSEDLLARAFMQRYLVSNVATPAVLMLAIQIESQLGDERAATNYMNQLLRDFPDSPEARQTLTSRN